MAEESSIFRKKSLDRLNAPENLRDYVKVTGPGLWIFLTAVIVFLAGVIVWACFGHLYTTVTTGARVENGTIYCYIPESDAEKLSDDMVIRIDDRDYTVDGDMTASTRMEQDCDPDLLHFCNMNVDSWAIVLQGEGSLEDGVYKAEVVLDSVTPMSFVIN